ncbi:MAG: hypothetical protein M0Z57_01775 [Deltaproteobacteria bacterium]|jgi:hypothetical protein|nr:hypothetical protein [Deltaproteobacteria bacterium]
MITGFQDVDLFFQNGLDGKYIVLAGYHKSGKTAFALSMAINIASDGYEVVYLSVDGKADVASLQADNILFKEYRRRKSGIKFYNVGDYEKIGSMGEPAVFIDGIKDLSLFLKQEAESPSLFIPASLTVLVSEIPVPNRLCKMPVLADLPVEITSSADMVLFLHDGRLIIAKNGDGPVGIVPLSYVEKYIIREYPEFGNCYIEKYGIFKDKNRI